MRIEKEKSPSCWHKTGITNKTNIIKDCDHCNYNTHICERQAGIVVREYDTRERVGLAHFSARFIFNNNVYYDSEGVDLNINDTSRKKKLGSRYSKLLRRLSSYLVKHRKDYKMRFITLTYADVVKVDSKDAISDFIKKLRYRGLRVHGYFWTSEYQVRGSLHYHIVILFDVKDDVRIDYIREAWKKGIIDVKTVDMKNTSNVVWYMSKYMLKALDQSRESRKRFYGRGGVLRTEIDLSESSVNKIMRYAGFKKSFRNRKGINYYYDDDSNYILVAYGQGGIKHVAYIARENLMSGRNCFGLESPYFFRFLSKKMFNIYLAYRQLEREFCNGSSGGLSRYYFDGENWVLISVSNNESYYEIEDN